MANRSGNSGCLILALLPIAFVLGKCSGDGTPRVDTLPDTPSVAAAQVETPRASDEERFIAIDRLNIRSSPNGRLAGNIERGARVEIHERVNGWVRISEDGTPARWVFEKHLCDGLGCASASGLSDTTTSSRQRSASGTRWNGYSDDSCPCSSSRNCFGPRGGRYCITSGGNKRYR